MIAVEMLDALNRVLPTLLAVYKGIRDEARRQAPSVPGFTDMDVVRLLADDGQALIDHADRILARQRP